MQVCGEMAPCGGARGRRKGGVAHSCSSTGFKAPRTASVSRSSCSASAARAEAAPASLPGPSATRAASCRSRSTTDVMAAKGAPRERPQGVKCPAAAHAARVLAAAVSGGGGPIVHHTGQTAAGRENVQRIMLITTS